MGKIHRYIRFYSIALSFVMLLASFGLSIDVHYCQGNVKSIGVFQKAEACSMQATLACAAHDNKSGISNQDCCKNVSVSEFLQAQSQDYNSKTHKVVKYQATRMISEADIAKPSYFNKPGSVISKSLFTKQRKAQTQYQVYLI